MPNLSWWGNGGNMSRYYQQDLMTHVHITMHAHSQDIRTRKATIQSENLVPARRWGQIWSTHARLAVRILPGAVMTSTYRILHQADLTPISHLSRTWSCFQPSIQHLCWEKRTCVKPEIRKFFAWFKDGRSLELSPTNHDSDRLQLWKQI